MEKEALGCKIREARKLRGYTQKALAETAQIGEVYLSEIERGMKMPSMNIFIRIVEALDISADYVLRDELTSGQEYICCEILEKLKDLSIDQQKTAMDILDAYLKNL